MRTIEENIRYYRKRRNLTQEKLVEMADINEKLISFYETGNRNPPIINLISIAEALNVTLDELCGVSSPKPNTELERELNKAIRDVIRKYKFERLETVEK